MGNASGTDKGRRAMSQVLLKPGASASTKQLKTIFSLYDTNNDGLLSWNEAKRYLSDLLELSGTQANVIREARETGQTNIAQWYEQYLREMFNHLDTNQDGFIDINELVKPGRNEVANLLAAVSSKIEAPAAPGKSLVLSSKMREENISTVLNSPTSAPCINGCGFYGSAEHYGYCPSCAKLIGDAINVAVLPEDPYPNAYGQAEAPHSNNEPAAPPPAPTEEPSKTPAAVTAEAPADPPVAPPKKVTKKKRVAKKGGKKGAAPKPEEVAKPDAEPEADAEGSGSDRELSSGEEELLDSAEGGGFLEESNHDRHMKFTVLDGDQVEKLMARKIRDAAELLGSTEDEAALVLMFFDWNSTRLQEQYFLNVDKYRVLAGIDLGGGKQPLKVQAGDCTICFETVKLSETASLNCGHGPFCKGCYGDYLGEKVKNYGASTILAAACMGKGCTLRLSPLHWKRMASPADYKRYQYFYLKQFVESTSNLGFCPNPTCTKVVKFSGLGRPADVVECMCGQKYCFSCCAEAHNPVSCEQLTLWREKNSSDTESIKFILATTKQCPHCHMATERNEGCNHMTCRKEVGGCGGQWCWMCRGDWATHGEKTGGYFSCNLYDKSAAKKIDENSGSVVLEAQYFEHFSQRFMNHGQLEEDANKKKEECVVKWMVEYREESGGLDPTFLLEALELLVRCRHTLKYTYVFSWFQDQAIKNKGSAPEASGNDNNAKDKFNKDLQLRLKKIQKKVQAKAGAAAASRAENASGAVALLQARKELFDFQQASLEGVTESLGELLFSGRVVEKAGELKSLTRITRQYLNNLVSGFEDMREDDEDLE